MDTQKSDMERPYKPDRLDNLKGSYNKDINARVDRDSSVKSSLSGTYTTAAHWVCMIGGSIIMLIGLAGFVAPNLFGMQLTWLHNLVHIVAGAAALYCGMNTTASVARNCCFILGGVFGVLGIAGFIFGVNTTLPVIAGSFDSFWWSLSPGNLMFGTADHIMHLVYAAVFVIGGALTTKAFDLKPDRSKTWH